MSNNLIVSYDLNSPGQEYTDVIAEIKKLGAWTKVQKSLWYVESKFSATQAVDQIQVKMDGNDSLIVIDASNNEAAWFGLSDQAANFIKSKWIA